MSFVGLSFLLFLVFQTKGKVPTSSYVRHGTVSCDRLFYGKEYWQTATVKASADHRSDTNVKKCSEFSNSDLSCETADSHDQPSTSSVNGTKTTTASKKFTCLSNVTANDKVVIINSSDVFSAVNETGSVCCAVLFFARWCRFSAKAAPAFNALVRVIPELQKFAVDMSSFSPLNSQLGIVSLPTLLFFKGGKVILRFNTTITLENVADFVMHYTGVHGSERDMAEISFRIQNKAALFINLQS
ncbi:thioredoxin domain-containing protein 15-like isoform X2 [Corticium candelabrum]|uniref:thioredoxin domain-containing protein 15-like isoform X2 n=1 Tax=Corticium candelabrum TaxID=121492 RepID=UPI002E256EA7|nr:thioredoxin domain-containing protein 15-like isoform X2 [Corticium candelabrum]